MPQPRDGPPVAGLDHAGRAPPTSRPLRRQFAESRGIRLKKKIRREEFGFVSSGRGTELLRRKQTGVKKCESTPPPPIAPAQIIRTEECVNNEKWMDLWGSTGGIDVSKNRLEEAKHTIKPKQHRK